MTQLQNRTELARLFTGDTVELGVAGGDFSNAILKHGSSVRHWAIDRWADHHGIDEYHRAVTRLVTTWGARCIVLRMTFADAERFFCPQSLDAVYIDGYAHTGQEGGKTLEDWWPKLKPGGIFAGHDYHSDFPLTIDAVNCFAERHGLAIELTGEVKYPSWWTTKPKAS
jgi:hypothetical protein